MKKALVTGGLLMLIGCGGGAAQQPHVPTSTASAPAAPPSGDASPSSSPPTPRPNIWALPEGPRDATEAPATPPKDLSTAAWAKASKTKGVGASPASCAAFAKPASVKPAPDLATALAETDPVKRNAMLFAIETTKPENGATLRAMRADLAPTECADVIVDPTLAAPTVSGAAGQMAIGLSLASKLARTASSAPVIKDASTKEKVKKFIQDTLAKWMVEQASAIESLSVPARELSGLARGIAAIEAGMADLRLVDRIRSSPTPSAWDKELKSVYEAALDEALEPRKARGRDAALVGLADFAAAGIVHDARVNRAHVLLSKLYGGRRIDALGALLLPPDDAKPTGAAVPESIVVLAASDPKPELFKSLASPSKSARARFEMGRMYWRRVDFVEAAYGAAKDTSPEGRLLLATSLALAKGPKSAKEMMAAQSPSALGLGNTDALDGLTSTPDAARVAGMAAFDAAHLRSLSAPDGAAAGPWFADVAARFEKAATLLEDPALKTRAKERAASADATAKAVGQAKPGS